MFLFTGCKITNAESDTKSDVKSDVQIEDVALDIKAANLPSHTSWSYDDYALPISCKIRVGSEKRNKNWILELKAPEDKEYTDGWELRIIASASDGTIDKYILNGMQFQEVGRINSENETLLFIKTTGGGSQEHDVHLNLLNLEKQELITLTLVTSWIDSQGAPEKTIHYSKNYNDASMANERKILEELKKEKGE